MSLWTKILVEMVIYNYLSDVVYESDSSNSAEDSKVECARDDESGDDSREDDDYFDSDQNFNDCSDVLMMTNPSNKRKADADMEKGKESLASALETLSMSSNKPSTCSRKSRKFSHSNQ
jgi:hypothetical protein